MYYTCKLCGFEFWKDDCTPIAHCERCKGSSLSMRVDDDFDYDDDYDYNSEEDD